MDKTVKYFKMAGFAIALVTGIGLMLNGQYEQGTGIVAASLSSVSLLKD